MNPAILLELAARWDRDAEDPNCTDGSPDAKYSNGVAAGMRHSKRECADALRSLISLLA